MTKHPRTLGEGGSLGIKQGGNDRAGLRCMGPVPIKVSHVLKATEKVNGAILCGVTPISAALLRDSYT